MDNALSNRSYSTNIWSQMSLCYIIFKKYTTNNFYRKPSRQILNQSEMFAMPCSNLRQKYLLCNQLWLAQRKLRLIRSSSCHSWPPPTPPTTPPTSQTPLPSPLRQLTSRSLILLDPWPFGYNPIIEGHVSSCYWTVKLFLSSKSRWRVDL